MREALTDVQKCEWDEADLIRRLCHALDIAQQAVARLAPNGYTDAEDLLINVRPEKVISETAVLLLAASAVARVDEVRMRIDQVARLLIPHRSERMRLGTCLEPALALDYSAAHACLSRIGYRDATFDELLRESSASQSRGGRERVPHQCSSRNGSHAIRDALIVQPCLTTALSRGRWRFVGLTNLEENARRRWRSYASILGVPQEISVRGVVSTAC